MNGVSKLLLFIFILVCIGRLILVFHGYPDGWHPDEWRIVLETLSMAQNQSLIPSNINYPLVFKYCLLLIYGIGYLFGKIFGYFSSPWDYAQLFFRSPEFFLIVPRILNSVFGIGIIIAGYILGKKLFNKKVAIIGALFLCLEYQLLAHSIYGLHQVLASLSTIPVFYFSYRYLYDSSKKYSALLGLAVGLAMSIHQTTVLFIPALIYLFAYLYFFLKKINISNIFVFIVAATPLSLVGNLFWLFDFKKSYAFFKLGNDVSKIAFSSHQVFKYDAISFISWFVQEIIKQDLVIGFFMILGIVFALIRRKREDWFLLVYLLSYIIFFYSWAFRWLHLLVGVLPILCIYGANVVYILAKKFNKSYLTFSLVIIFIISTFFSLRQLVMESVKVDTRAIAKKWLLNNIETDQRIAIDWAAYNVNIPSSVPIYLRNPIGRKYYDNGIPKSIKDSIEPVKKYNIVEAMYNSSTPLWPKNMPADEVALAQKSSTLVDLYGYYNFLELPVLSTKADYLIISSYSYGMFLYDNDRYKTNLFNPYIKDDMVKYQSHVDKKQENNQHGLVTYVAQRGRDFYHPLLNKENPNFIEIARFEPDNNLTGPTLIIFKIIPPSEK